MPKFLFLICHILIADSLASSLHLQHARHCPHLDSFPPAFFLTIADCSTCSTFYSYWTSNNLFLCLPVLPPLLYAFIFRIYQQLIVSFCLMCMLPMCMLPINDHITPLINHSLIPSYQSPPQVITPPHQSPSHYASTTTSSLCIIRVNHHFITLRHHLITAPITHYITPCVVCLCNFMRTNLSSIIYAGIVSISSSSIHAC
jgi:hypothetical protein